MLVATFAGLILVGTALLRLPVSQAQDTAPLGIVDALFTATSAVCVTGLITRDTATDFSRTGQTIILILIQLGALGVMTFAALAFHAFGLRMSFGSQAVLQSMFFQDEARGRLRTALLQIVAMTFGLEAVGMLLLWPALRDAQVGGAFEAMFLSISAFCNAGFSVYRNSLEHLSALPVVVWTVAGLAVVGGLGYMVLFEIARRLAYALRRRPQHPVNWSLHARVVLVSSAALVVLGALGLTATGLTASEDTPGARIEQAVFHSVTARTAGFSMLPVGDQPTPALMILIPLMFVGGSPGSCAGGIKTTSLVVWLSRVAARMAGRSDVAIGRRRIPQDVVRRAALVLALAALWNATGVFVLAVTEGAGRLVRLEDVMFEQVSAFATVGLSTGLTAHLTMAGKLWIIASMFVGRLGPLTIALAVIRQEIRPRYHYPCERVMIG